jgi:hypothetical protein
MSWRSVPLPSPAMAVALCALFVALGGASHALTLPRDSVGPKQLRARAVTSTKLGTGAVTARALRDGAVSGRKIAPGGVSPQTSAGGRCGPQRAAAHALAPQRARGRAPPRPDGLTRPRAHRATACLRPADARPAAGTS